MISMDHVDHILEICDWLPSVVSLVITLPPDSIFNCSAKAFAVEYLLDVEEKLIFLIVIKLHFVTLALYKWREHCSVDNVVNANTPWQVQFIGVTTDNFQLLGMNQSIFA